MPLCVIEARADFLQGPRAEVNSILARGYGMAAAIGREAILDCDFRTDRSLLASRTARRGVAVGISELVIHPARRAKLAQ